MREPQQGFNVLPAAIHVFSDSGRILHRSQALLFVTVLWFSLSRKQHHDTAPKKKNTMVIVHLPEPGM